MHSSPTQSDTSCLICNMSIDTEKAHDGMIMCVKCGNSSLLVMVNTKLVAHITVKTSQQRNMQFICFNDALHSLVNTTHTPQPLCDIPLDELKKLILNQAQRKYWQISQPKLLLNFFYTAVNSSLNGRNRHIRLL